MKDLILAEQTLKQKNLTLVIVKEGKILFKTETHGIRGLVKAVEELGKSMEGSSVADRIVGKAAALLCVYAQIVAIFAPIIDEKAIRTLRENNVLYRYEKKISHILDSTQKGMCPFEKLLVNITDPKEAYETLKNCF